MGIWGGLVGIQEGLEWFLGIKKGFKSTWGMFLGIWGCRGVCNTWERDIDIQGDVRGIWGRL